MTHQDSETLRRLMALANTTDQTAFREISSFAVATDSARDAEAREAARKLLVTAANSFTRLLSMTFQAVAWNKEVLYEQDSFREIYEKVLERTEGFSKVDDRTVAHILADHAPSLLVFRSIAALSLDELSLLLKQAQGLELSKDQMRAFELGREVGKAEVQRWREASGPLAKTLCDSIGGELLELPSTAPKTLFKSRKDKTDTKGGWRSVRVTARQGVPYWELLYQRYVGGFFRQAMDASSSIKGDILEMAIVQLLSTNHIPFYRTRASREGPILGTGPRFPSAEPRIAHGGS